MSEITRRDFLALNAGALAGAAFLPLFRTLPARASESTQPLSGSRFEEHWRLDISGMGVRLVSLEHGQERVEGVVHYTLKFEDHILQPNAVVIVAPHIVRAEFDDAVITEHWSGNANLACARRQFIIDRSGLWRMSFEFATALRDQEWCVPAVSYFKNAAGTGAFPRGGKEKGWSFREDRSPLPSAAVLWNRDRAQAIFCSPARSEDYISSTQTQGNRTSIWIPYGEGPKRYVDKGVLGSGNKKANEYFYRVVRGEHAWTQTRDFFVWRGQVSHFTEALEQPVRAFRESVAPEPYAIPDVPAWDEIRRLKFAHLDRLYYEKKEIAGLRMGVENGISQFYYERICGSFLSPGLDAAAMWAEEGVRTQSPALVARAQKIGDFFLRGRLPNGLHQDAYDLRSGKWTSFFEPAIKKEWANGINARANGETMRGYLRLYLTLRNAGIHRHEYIDLVLETARFYVGAQLPSGSFGRYWSKEGKLLDDQGSNGAHILALLLKLERALGSEAARHEAIVKGARYYRELAREGRFTGDALDSDCYDRESAAIVLSSLLDAHAYLRDPELLDGAVEAARFILSWTWQYDIPFDKSTPLGSRKFRTRGMTSVSVAHQHLDLFGVVIAYDFFRLTQLTGDVFWRDQARDMLTANRQLIATSQDRLGKSAKLVGYQPEQIYHTDWTFLPGFTGERGEFTGCLAWVGVWTLKSLLEIARDFPEELTHG